VNSKAEPLPSWVILTTRGERIHVTVERVTVTRGVPGQYLRARHGEWSAMHEGEARIAVWRLGLHMLLDGVPVSGVEEQSNLIVEA